MRHAFALTDAPHGIIRGDIYLPEPSMGVPVVIGLHGFKGFKDWGFWPETGRRFSEAGIALVAFNFSGSGIGEDDQVFSEFDAFADNTISREIDDLGRVLEAVTAREVPLEGADIRRLGLLGHSRGGGVTLVRGARDPRVGAVATWNGVSHFDRFSKDDIREWRARGFAEVLNARTGQVFRLHTSYLDDLERHGDAYSPVEAMRRMETPTLVVHGTRDETVDPDEAERLSRAAGPGVAQLVWIQGGNHTFGAKHPFDGSTPQLDQALEKTLSWFADTL